MGVIIMPLALVVYGLISYTLWTFYSERPSLILPSIIGLVVLIIHTLWKKPVDIHE